MQNMKKKYNKEKKDRSAFICCFLITISCKRISISFEYKLKLYFFTNVFQIFTIFIRLFLSKLLTIENSQMFYICIAFDNWKIIMGSLFNFLVHFSC